MAEGFNPQGLDWCGEYIFPAHIFKPRQFDDAFAILPMHTVAPNR